MKQGAGGRAQGAGARARRLFFRALRPALCALFLSCATTSTTTPQLTAPDWPAIPPGLLDAFCARLQMDAIATGPPLSLISTTRPLATPQSLNALGLLAQKRVKSAHAVTSIEDLNRSLPVVSEGASCAWNAFAASQLNAHRDELVVELSAPGINPFEPKMAGLFARVSVGGEGASWYWITLLPRGGRWVVGPIYVLVQ